MTGHPCPPIPSTDPDWPEPTLCQHHRCARLRRETVRGGPMWANTPRGPVAVPPAPIGAMAVWLLEHLDSIRQDEAAGELLADLQAIRSELRAAVDNRQYRYAGPCTAVLIVAGLDTMDDGSVIRIGPTEQRPCGADLRIREGAKTIVCRACGAEYELAERMVAVLAKIRGEMATGQDVAYLLSDALGVRVTWASVRKMEHSGHISHVTTDDLERKLYLVGDVLDVVLRRLKLSLPNSRITA